VSNELEACIHGNLTVFQALGSISASVKAIYHDKKFLSSTSEIPAGTSFGIILDKTCFYAEAGGQEYDTGSIALDVKDKEAKFEVIDCQSFKGYVLHIGHMEEGQMDIGDNVIATYDPVRTFTSFKVLPLMRF
jgi:alanyl-tRNA synthetase